MFGLETKTDGYKINRFRTAIIPIFLKKNFEKAGLPLSYFNQGYF
jgi:hypothetical protein